MAGAKYVISWRRRTKERMVKSFGNKCSVCDNTYPQEIFEFHHLKPETKEFNLGRIRSNCFSWERIVIELRKCIMVCANCHRLIENNYIEVPLNPKRFNEKYTDYKKNSNIQKRKEKRPIKRRKKKSKMEILKM